MLYLLGIFLAFFLSFVLITKKDKNAADFILSAWLCILGLNLVAYYLLLTNQYQELPSFVVFGTTLPLAHGPFLYLYVKKQTSQSRFLLSDYLHFLPLVVGNILFASFYLSPFSKRLDVVVHEGQGYGLEMLVRTYGVYLSGIIYVSLSLLALYRYRKNMVQQFSNTEKINFNWLLYLIIWIIVIWFFVLFIQKDSFIYAATAFFILWLGYFGIKQVHVFHQPRLSENDYQVYEKAATNYFHEETAIDEAEKKYKNSGLTANDIDAIHSKLIQLLEEDKPFVNPNLTLNELAKMLEIHPNYLSQVINSKEEKNFYELINEKRIDEFVKKLENPENKQYTLLAIAYECGFNSKASFNRNFKKYFEVTPSEYQKKLES
ncbi:AraC-like DNA-binding protein [Flavobacterium lindanitolerans]|uniref:AraC-like DNA-binding protein n=1 Tax=Flavobacterium lindanitolerans TaxID=428988 RepID=A0A497UUR6_9FLAO|nr:AraC-like DNA-binding protein [Flavobacterium lindanitolerans]RLJ34871.1 AraC-like DNA-binding protein [Flavobacterium lindanitolerans]